MYGLNVSNVQNGSFLQISDMPPMSYTSQMPYFWGVANACSISRKYIKKRHNKPVHFLLQNSIYTEINIYNAIII